MKDIYNTNNLMDHQRHFFISGMRRAALFLVLLMALLLNSRQGWGQTTVTYTQQTANYYSTWTTGTAGAFNQGANQVGMFANGGGTKQVVSWRKFRTDGSGASTSDRALQVGDRFIVTLSATRAFGKMGFALLASPGTGSWANRESNYAISFNLDGPAYAGAGIWGNWYARFNGGSTSAGSANVGGQQTTYKNFTFTLTLTAPDRMNASWTDGTTTSTLNDILLNTSNPITDYSIFLEDDWDGGASRNIFWGLGAVGNQHTVTNQGALNHGQSNGSYTIGGVMFNGLDANSTSLNALNNTFNKSGTGNVTLNAANTYVGQTQIDNGELWIGSTGSIAAGSGIFVGNGGQPTNVTKLWLSNASGGTTFSNNFTINNGNATTREVGGLNTSGTHTFSGNITNNSTTGGTLLSTVNAGGSVTFSGVLSGAGAYTTQGAGTITFSGASANTYTGATTVNAGTLVLNKTAGLIAIPTNTTIAAGATIRTDAANQWGTGTPPLVTINGNGILNLNNNNQRIALASASATASVTLGSATLDINNTGTDTYAGVISGSGGVTKTNTGVEILTNTSNSYTGATTITGGEIRLNPSANATFASQIILNGGTLGTAGITATRTWTSSSTLNLNANSTIALGTGSHTLTYANSSAVSWAGTLLTITGWTGPNNGVGVGTAGRIFIGNSATSLSPSQLSKIVFNISSVLYSAVQLSTGEIIASGATPLYYGGATAAWNTANWSTNNAAPYSTAWSNGRHAIFNVSSTNLTGFTINFPYLTVNENTTIATIGGTIGAAGQNSRIFVASGRTMDFSTNVFSTSATYAITKNGPGTLALAGGTYGGGFTLNEGLVVARGVNALGGNATPGPLTINGGTIGANGTRDFTGKFSIINFNADFALGSGVAPSVATSNLTFNANVALGSSVTRTLTLGGTGLYSWNGVISGIGSNFTLAATAAGTLSLGAANTYGGNTTINGGTLACGIANALPSTTTVTLANTSGASLSLGANSQSIAGLAGGGTIGGNVSLGTATLTLTGAATNTFSGAFSATAGNLVLNNSSAVLTLANAANGHTGTTTVTAGELRLNPASNATFASQIVLNGGTLSTSGITAGRTWTNTATLNLNANSTIALGSGNHTLTFANSSGLTWTGTTLTITGWTGTAGASGTGGKIIVGAGGLLPSQLSKISFSGYPGTPIILAGELVPPAPAVNYNWIGTTSTWTTPGNWSPAGPPTSNDNVQIDPTANAYSVAPDVSSAITIGNLTVANGGTYSVSATGTLTVNGSYTYTSATAATFNCASTLNIFSGTSQNIPAHSYGNLNLTGGPRVLASSGTIGICGSYTQGSSMTVTGSTVNFNGSGAQTIAAGSYNNLTISNNRGAALVDLPSGTISVGGTFDLSGYSSSTNPSNTVNAANVFDFTSSGAQSIPAFFYGQVNNTGNGPRTWAASGIIDINQGFTPGTGTHTITGSTVRYSATSGTYNLATFPTNLTSPSRQYNNLIFNGAGGTWTTNGITLGIAGNLNVTAGTLIGGATAGVPFNGGSSTLNIDGNLTIDGGSLNLTSSSAATNTGTINLSGNFAFSSGTFNKSGSQAGTINFNNTAAGAIQTIQQAASGATITNNGTVWNFGNGTTTNIIRLISNLTMTNGTINARQNASIDFQSFTLSGSAAFAAVGTSPGTTLVTQNANGISGGTAASGSLLVTGTRTLPSGVNYTFNGTSPQNTGNALNPQTGGQSVRNLVINNPTTVTITPTAGSGNASDAVQISNLLDLQQGIIILTTRDLQLNSTATISGAPFSASKMIVTTGTSSRFNGRLLKLFPAAPQSNITFTYPIGDITGVAEYTPFTITDLDYTTASGPFLALKVKDNKAPLDASIDNYLTRTFETTTGSSGLTTATGLNLVFNASYIPGSSDVVGNDNLFIVNRFNWGTGTWQEDALTTCGAGILSNAGNPITSGLNVNNQDITGRITLPIYFRSNVNSTGIWENTASWLASTDVNFVSPAGVEPSTYPIYSNSEGIRILTDDSITVTTAAAFGGIPLDQATVDAGAKLIIAPGSILTVQNGTGTDLSVSGRLVNQSTSASSIGVGSSVIIENSAVYEHRTNAGTIPAGTWNAGSLCYITGTTNTAPSGFTGQSFSDVFWNTPGMSTGLNLSSGLTSARDVVFHNTGSFNLGLTATTALNATFRNMTINTGALPVMQTGATGANNVAVNLTGDLTINGGSLTIAGSSAAGTGTRSFAVAGNVNNNSTSGTSLVVNAGSGTVGFSVGDSYTQNNGAGSVSVNQSSGTGNFVVQNDFTLTSGNFYLNNAGTGSATLTQNASNRSFSINGGTLALIQTTTAPGTRPLITIGGNFVQTNGNIEYSTAYTGTLNPPGEIRVARNFTRSGSGYIRNTNAANNALILFNGTSTYNSSSTGNFTYTNVTVNAGNTLTLASNLTFSQATASPSQTLTVNGVLDCGTNLVTESAAGATFSLPAAGTLLMGSPAGITSSGATGNIQTTTRIFGAANYVYTGNGNQASGNGLPASIATLTISNSGTAPNNVLSLTNTTSASGAVTFTGGMLDLGTSDLSAGSVSGAGNLNYVRTSSTGQLRQVVGGVQVTFPVGNSAYNPFQITNSGTSDTYGVRVLDVIASPAPNDPTYLINRYWAVTEATAGGSNLAVTGQYNSGEEGVNFASGTTLKIGLFSVASWSENNASSTGTGPFAVASGSNFVAVGTFGIGKDLGFINPLTIYTWTGLGAAGSWTDPNNWSPNTSAAGPMVGDDIIINAPGSGSNNLNITGSHTIANVTFNGTGVLNMANGGLLTINGTVTYGGSFTANLNCSSTITYNNPASLSIPPFNYGNLSNAASSVRTWTAGATTGICGTLTTGTGSTFTAGAGSTVNFNGTGAQTINPLNYDNLTVNTARSGSTLTSPSGTIQVAGTFTPSGVSNFTPSVDPASTFNFSSASSQNIPAFFYGQITNSGNGPRTWANSGVIDISQGFTPGTGTQTITGSTIRYSNTDAVTWSLTSFTTNIAGRQYNNLEFTGGASTAWQIGTAFNMGIAGNLTLSGAGRLIANPTSSIVTWTVDGNLDITGSGNLTVSNSTGTTNFNVTGNATVGTGSGTLTVVGSSTGAGLTTSLSVNDLIVSGSASMNLDAASNTALASVTVNGNATVTSTAADAINLGSGTNNSNNTINIRGNFTKSGSGTLGLSGTYSATAIYNFNGSTTQTWNHSGAARTGGGITVASGSTLQLATNLVSASSANANPINIAGELDCQGFAVQASNATNTFALNATGTLRTASTSGIAGAVTGFTPAPSFASGGTFIFTGTNVNTGFAGFTGISTSNSYTITWQGSTILTLDKTMNLNVFNFANNGLVNLGNFNISLPSTAGALTGTGFGSGKMFVTNGTGILIRAVTSAGVGLPFTWPIGESTGVTEYSPVTISSIASAGINGSIGFRVIDGVHPDLASATSYLSRYWPCTVTGFNASYTLGSSTFTYDSGTDVVAGPEGSLRGNSYNSTVADWTQYATSSAGSNVLTITSGMGGAFMPTAGPGTYDITGRIDVPVYYRTAASGAWQTTTSWQVSSDINFVSPAPSTPATPPNNSNSEGIFIRNTHAITSASSFTADDLTIQSGGSLEITNNSFTLANGSAATDMTINSGGLFRMNSAVNNALIVSTGALLQVDGTMRQSGSASPDVTNNGTIVIGATGTYNHNRNAGTIPTCTWTSGATCLLDAVASNMPGGLAQSFHHFTLNTTLTSSVNCSGNLQTVNGDLSITTNHASNEFRLSTGTAYTLSVGGNLNITNGFLSPASGGSGPCNLVVNGTSTINGALSQLNKTGAATVNYTFNGDFTQNAGTFEFNSAGSSNTTVNFRGNVVWNGTVNRTNGGVHTINFDKTTGLQTLNAGATFGAGSVNWNVGSGSSTNTLRMLSNLALNNSTQTFTVANGATMDFQNFVLSGGSTTFTTGTSPTLMIGSPAGIMAAGSASGNIQTLVRTVNATTTYIYTGSSNQNSGTLLPATLSGAGRLTISNTGAAGDNTLTLTNTLPMTTPQLNLTSGLLAIGSGQTLIISSGGTVNGTGGDFATGATGGMVRFSTPSGGAFNGNLNPFNVETNGNPCGVNFGAQTVTIQSGGTFTINAGGFVNLSPPAYASGSTLNYNTGADYGRGLEWSATSGKGYPHHVNVSNTTLNPASGSAVNAAVPFQCAGNLTISSGGNIYMDFGGNNMTEDLRVLGNLNLQGQLSGSQAVGSDIFIGGNWTNNGTAANFFPNGREVVFNGASGQTIGGTNTNVPAFAFLAITKSSGDVTLNFSTNSTVTVNNRFQLNSGKLILGNHNLVLAPGCASMNTGDENHYVVTNGTGVFRQQVLNNGSDFWYPMGPSTTVFGPVTLNQSLAGVTDNIDVRVVVTPSFTNAVNDNAKMVNLEWTLNEGSAGGNSLSTNFGWKAASEAASFDRTAGVYHGHFSGSRYVIRATNPTTGIATYFSRSTASQPYTGDLNPSQRFVIGNLAGILPCLQTSGAGSWSDVGKWLDGIVPPAGSNVCIKHAMTLSSSVPNPDGVTFETNGSLSISNGTTLTLGSPGTITNSRGSFLNMNSGNIAFSGLGIVNGAHAIGFNYLELNGNTTLTTTPTINGTLEIKAGGFLLSATGPNYGASSTLKYNTGGSYNRSNEWNSSSGAGYPASVQISGGTSLDISAGAPGIRRIAGNLTIDAGSSLSQGASNQGLIVPGNFTLNGTYNMGSVTGGDLVVSGNWVSGISAILNHNNRDIRFDGTGSQFISVSNGLQFGFLTVDNSGSGLDLLSTIAVNTFRVNAARTFNLTTDKIIIASGGNLLNNGTFNANVGTIEYTNGGDFTNNGTFNRGTSTIDFIGASAGEIVGSVQTNFHNIRLFPGGGVDFGSGLLRGKVSGTLQLRAGSYIANNAPIYEPGSKLLYSGGGVFSRNVEWDPATLQKVEISNNTELSCGGGVEHTIADSLIINTGSALSLNGVNTPLTVGGNMLNRGTLTLSGTAGGDMNIAGDFINNGTFNANSRLVTFTGSNNAVIGGTSNTSFSLLTINKISSRIVTVDASAFTLSRSGGASLRVQAGILDLNGRSMTLGAGANTLRVDAGFAGGQTLRTGGTSISGFTSFTNDGVNPTILGGKVDFTGTSGIETIPAAIATFEKLWNTGLSQKNIGQNILVSDSVLIADGSTLNFTAGNLSMDVLGNVVNNGTISGPATSKLLLSNTTGQSLSGTGSTHVLEINDPAGVSVTGRPVISTALNVVDGKLNTGSDTIILGSSATITENFSTGSYVLGKVMTSRSVNTAASNFGGLGVELTAGDDLGNVEIIRSSGDAGLITNLPVLGLDTSIRWNWTITPDIQPNADAPNRSLTLSWPALEDNNRNASSMQIWKRSTVLDPWEEAGTLQTAGGTSVLRSVVWSDVTGFSQFTVGENDIPLALDLLSFTARKEKNFARIEWTVSPDKKAFMYKLEKSTDNGKNFSVIESLLSDEKSDSYTAFDFRFISDSYYRVRVIREDGSEDVSRTVFLKAGDGSGAFVIVPNPASAGSGIRLQSSVKRSDTEELIVTIYSPDGKVSLKLRASSEDMNLLLEEKSALLPAGVYQVQVQYSSGSESLRFVKE
jgi:autotransporter-associated beta strand protein